MLIWNPSEIEASVHQVRMVHTPMIVYMIHYDSCKGRLLVNVVVWGSSMAVSVRGAGGGVDCDDIDPAVVQRSRCR